MLKGAAAQIDQRFVYVHHQEPSSTAVGDMVLSEIRPALIHSWFQSLKLQPVSKGHVRSLMRLLFDRATLWEYLPLELRTPLELVKIKKVTKRSKEPVVITHEQFRAVVPKLPAHVNMIAVVAGCRGLRVSEALGLKWSTLIGRNGSSQFREAPIEVPSKIQRRFHLLRGFLWTRRWQSY